MASGAEAVFQEGAAALEAGDFAAAERLFRSIVEADPRVHPAWNALSVVAVNLRFTAFAVQMGIGAYWACRLLAA